jgi:hypothetical protein
MELMRGPKHALALMPSDPAGHPGMADAERHDASFADVYA